MREDGRVTTRFEATMDYPAPLARVWTMLGDESYLSAKVGAALSGDFTVDEDGIGRTVRIARTLAVDLPPTARALLGTEISLIETHTWGAADGVGERTADLGVDIAGAPITVTGALALRATATGGQVVVTADITVRVPLFSGMAESLIRDELARAINDEAELGRAWLARM